MRGPTDVNLMWLLDFKVDSLFGGESVLGTMDSMDAYTLPIPPQNGSESGHYSPVEVEGTTEDGHYFSVVELNEEGIVLDDVAHFENVQSCDEGNGNGNGTSRPSVPAPTYKKKKRGSTEKVVPAAAAAAPVQAQNPELSFGNGKPNNTYTEIISMALEEHPT